MNIRHASDLCLPPKRGESLRTGTLLSVCIAPTAVARISGGEAQNIPYHADADFVGMMNLYKKWTKTFTYPRKNAGDDLKPLTARAV